MSFLQTEKCFYYKSPPTQSGASSKLVNEFCGIALATATTVRAELLADCSATAAHLERQRKRTETTRARLAQIAQLCEQIQNDVTEIEADNDRIAVAVVETRNRIEAEHERSRISIETFANRSSIGTDNHVKMVAKLNGDTEQYDQTRKERFTTINELINKAQEDLQSLTNVESTKVVVNITKLLDDINDEDKRRLSERNTIESLQQGLSKTLTKLDVSERSLVATCRDSNEQFRQNDLKIYKSTGN